MDDETLERVINDIQEGVLQQGIIIKVLIDIMLEKDVMNQDEFDEKILATSKKVEDEIKKLENEMDKFDNNSSVFYGQGGDA